MCRFRFISAASRRREVLCFFVGKASPQQVLVSLPPLETECFDPNGISLLADRRFVFPGGRVAQDVPFCIGNVAGTLWQRQNVFKLRNVAAAKACGARGKRGRNRSLRTFGCGINYMSRTPSNIITGPGRRQLELIP